MRMQECPKYKHCSASICPLWKPINEQFQLKGERVCFYLIESQKSNAITNFTGAGLSDVYEAITKAVEQINISPDANTYLKKTLIRSRSYGSRLINGMNLIKKRGIL